MRESITKSTIKSLIDGALKSTIKLEFKKKQKKTNSIKTKYFKYVVKKILPTL